MNVKQRELKEQIQQVVAVIANLQQKAIEYNVIPVITNLSSQLRALDKVASEEEAHNRKVIENLKQQVKQVTEEINHSQVRGDKLLHRLEEFNHERDVIQERYAIVDEERKNLEEENSALTLEIYNLRQEQSRIRKSRKMLKQRLAETEQELSEKKDDLRVADDAMLQLQEKELCRECFGKKNT